MIYANKTEFIFLHPDSNAQIKSRAANIMIKKTFCITQKAFNPAYLILFD